MNGNTTGGMWQPKARFEKHEKTRLSRLIDDEMF